MKKLYMASFDGRVHFMSMQRNCSKVDFGQFCIQNNGIRPKIMSYVLQQYEPHRPPVLCITVTL